MEYIRHTYLCTCGSQSETAPLLHHLSSRSRAFLFVPPSRVALSLQMPFGTSYPSPLLLGFRPSPLLSPKAKTDKVSQDGIASPPPPSSAPSISFSSFVVVASLMEERERGARSKQGDTPLSFPARESVVCPSIAAVRPELLTDTSIPALSLYPSP